MSYAVLQTNPEPPSTEQLSCAFQGVPGLTPMDAQTIGRDATGILAKGFSLENAALLKDSLASQGIEATVVEESALPVLPETFALSRLDCTPEKLLVYDSIGRVAEVEWPHVHLIAAGNVVVTEFKQVPSYTGHAVDRGVQMIREMRHRSGHHGVTGIGLVTGNHWLDLAELAAVAATHNLPDVEGLSTRTKEEHEQHCLLEIVLAGNVARYVIRSDHLSPLLFRCLGDRATKNVAHNFALLVTDLVRLAPDAAINRGAFFWTQDKGSFLYRNKTAFYNEMIWLLW